MSNTPRRRRWRSVLIDGEDESHAKRLLGGRQRPTNGEARAEAERFNVAGSERRVGQSKRWASNTGEPIRGYVLEPKQSR